MASFLATCALTSVCSGETFAHDGFYFQGELGAGHLRSKISQSGSDVSEILYGPALAGSALFGGIPAPRFVVGGGVVFNILFSPRYEFTSGGPQPRSGSDPGSLSLYMIGPFADFYPDAHRGLHFQALAGFAALLKHSGSAGLTTAGFGFLAGVGYDFFVAPRLSVGVLGRFEYAATAYGGSAVTGEGSGGSTLSGTTYSTILPTLALTITHQ